jgi:dTDP-4-dehydrorhamnose reductase
VRHQRIAVLGAGGQLGRQFVLAFQRSGAEVIAFNHGDLELADPTAGTRVIRAKPKLVVNAAAWTDVDACARDPSRAMEINGHAPGRLARAAAEIGAKFVQMSTNEVFAGDGDAPYQEDDDSHPVNPYGASKLEGELSVAASGADYLIVRTAWIFGPDATNFPSKIVAAADRHAATGVPLRVVEDEWGNPTWAPDLARAIGAAVDLGAWGTLHLAGEPATTRFGWAQQILDGMGVRLEAIPGSAYERPAPVPRKAVLDVSRARTLGIASMDWRPPSALYAAQLRNSVTM